MSASERTAKSTQLFAWAVASLFLIGFAYSPVGLWTGAILAAWFVGTQRPLRGFILQLAIVLVPTILTHLRAILATDYSSGLIRAGQLSAGAILSVLPFSIHRILSRNLRGWMRTLPLPFSGLACRALALYWLSPAPTTTVFRWHGSSAFAEETTTLLVYWVAATLLCFWNRELGSSWRTGLGGISCLAVLAVLCYGCATLSPAEASTMMAWICMAAIFILGIWSMFRRVPQSWSTRRDIVGILQSPETCEPLRIVRENRREFLASPSGERYPVRNGIAVVLRPKDLTGLNGKYNRLYEIIGGFYDDAQRVVCALIGLDRDAYVRSYLEPLEVKAGDSVLETSVGTGLNFQYLPHGVRLCGLDLSPEMLANCQNNLQRWGLEADLLLGNAESLPFADSSFDVVFHVGGINFFNDRGRAIREMIRVAKPGTRILIADETEEHVQANYEKMPLTGEFFKHRTESVAAPVDLVPPEMREIRLETLQPMGKNRFYVLTFRKPLPSAQTASMAEICEPSPL